MSRTNQPLNNNIMEEIKLGRHFKLEASVEGGVWSTSNPSIATITEDGYVDTLSVGIVTFTYEYTDELGCISKTYYQIKVTCSDSFVIEVINIEIPKEILHKTTETIQESSIVELPTIVDDDIVNVPVEVTWSYEQDRFDINIQTTDFPLQVQRWSCCNGSQTVNMPFQITYNGYNNAGVEFDNENKLISYYSNIKLTTEIYNFEYVEPYWDKTVEPPIILTRDSIKPIQYSKKTYVLNEANKTQIVYLEQDVCIN